MKDHQITGYYFGIGRDELTDQMLVIIESPEFQRWKLVRQVEEPTPFLDLGLGLDDPGAL